MTNEIVDPGPAGPLDETLPRASAPAAAFQRRTTMPPGQMLEGRFKITRALGKGAMGAVYLAEDQMLGGPPIVLKLMTAHGGAGSADHEQFRREVLSARSVVHPNVVRVFDYHILGGVPAITMEYLPGGTLDELRGQNPSLSRWLQLLAEVADALQAVHAAGIIHRDLKPQNIMLGPDGRARVTDFGIARKTASVETSVQCYTPMYAAPEQIRDELLNTRTDIYAFGAMAFHLLAGQPPFPKDATLEGHLKHAPPSLMALVPGLPPEVDQLIHRCMDKDPRRRPDAETVTRQLRDAAMALEPSREAAVLRIDLVAFPSWMTQQHQGALHALTDVLAESPEVKAATSADLLKLPLRDGVVLVFLRSTEAAYRTAIDVARGFKNRELAARIGLHHGSVKMVADLNGRLTAVGGGVTSCERIMSCGSSGHILASKRFCNVLLMEDLDIPRVFEGPFDVWDAMGGQHTVWNIRTAGLGQDFHPSGKPPRIRLIKRAAAGTGIAAVLAAAGVAAWSMMSPPAPPAANPAPVAVATPAPERPVVAPPAPVVTPPAPAVQVATTTTSTAPPETHRAPTASETRRTAPPPTTKKVKPTAETTITPVKPEPTEVRVAAPVPAPVVAVAAPPPRVEAPKLEDRSAAAREALQEASAAMRGGDFDGAVAKANTALKLDSTLSAAHKVLGVAYSRLKKYCDSKKHYQTYLAQNPNADNAPGVRKALEARDYVDCP